MEEILEQVRLFAEKAHGEQTRKYSAEGYVFHLVRVMEMCREHSQKLPVLAAALLHDVLEDTPVKKEEIRTFLSGLLEKNEVEYTLKLVIELTDIYIKKDYPKWNRRKRKAREAERIEKTSADAQTVKYADIIDNCREVIEKDPQFAAVFLRECKNLLAKITKGNRTLYNQAVKTVNDRLWVLLR
ncbi:HD domain-containing protein [Desertivirga brevis]|uniref:HD domain-containing protein n=1 Tax=Desertivirga brevis TaxID=2810310 RepID=UPI001A9796E3|nr:HD domain-containing protein [Pedobacter sp. SYSU D00873]